ncbi:hypothetical protein AM586_24510 [Massilia sp. WG5]|nr:hypothetical protein AM586_24510 [Massilia sp. WG5]
MALPPAMVRTVGLDRVSVGAGAGAGAGGGGGGVDEVGGVGAVGGVTVVESPPPLQAARTAQRIRGEKVRMVSRKSVSEASGGRRYRDYPDYERAKSHQMSPPVSISHQQVE